MTHLTRHINVSINRAANDVYNFMADPLNLPKWASGLANAELKKIKDYWVTPSPMGEVKVKFVEHNAHGVLDHEVTLPNGEKNYNPLRVIKNSDGCDVVFTLFHLPRMTEEEFYKDAKWIENDLLTLKSIMEKSN